MIYMCLCKRYFNWQHHYGLECTCSGTRNGMAGCLFRNVGLLIFTMQGAGADLEWNIPVHAPSYIFFYHTPSLIFVEAGVRFSYFAGTRCHTLCVGALVLLLSS